MTADEIKICGIVASIAVIILSLIFGIYKYKRKTNYVVPVPTTEEIRSVLAYLITKLDSSQISTIHSHAENWMYGFRGLEEGVYPFDAGM